MLAGRKLIFISTLIALSGNFEIDWLIFNCARKGMAWLPVRSSPRGHAPQVTHDSPNHITQPAKDKNTLLN
jgi:hypothetical protein